MQWNPNQCARFASSWFGALQLPTLVEPMTRGGFLAPTGVGVQQRAAAMSSPQRCQEGSGVQHALPAVAGGMRGRCLPRFRADSWLVALRDGHGAWGRSGLQRVGGSPFGNLASFVGGVARGDGSSDRKLLASYSSLPDRIDRPRVTRQCWRQRRP